MKSLSVPTAWRAQARLHGDLSAYGAPARCVTPPGYCHGRGRQARPASPPPACGSLSQSPAPPEPVATLGESGGAAYCPTVGKLQLGRGGGAGNAVSRPPAPTGRGQKWSARPSCHLRDSKLLPAAFSVPGSGRCVPSVSGSPRRNDADMGGPGSGPRGAGLLPPARAQQGKAGVALALTRVSGTSRHSSRTCTLTKAWGFHRGHTMATFTCQLDWDTGCPGTWPITSLGLSVRGSLNEAHI